MTYDLREPGKFTVIGFHRKTRLVDGSGYFSQSVYARWITVYIRKYFVSNRRTRLHSPKGFGTMGIVRADIMEALYPCVRMKAENM